MKRGSLVMPRQLSRLSALFALAVIVVLTSLTLSACGAAPVASHSGSALNRNSSASSVEEGATATACIVAPSIDQSSGSSTTTTTEAPQTEKVGWGRAAVLPDITIAVTRPVDSSNVQAPRPDSNGPDFKGLYSVVTITNTGKTAITIVQSDFVIEGHSSGSSGLVARPGFTVGGYAGLSRETLEPGRTVTRSLLFGLAAADEPVKVRVQASWTGQVLVSWQ